VGHFVAAEELKWWKFPAFSGVSSHLLAWRGVAAEGGSVYICMMQRKLRIYRLL